MIKYSILQSKKSQINFCGSPILKPLSKACGLNLDDKYFLEESLLSKVPSYAWYDEDKIVAFVLNDQCITKYGLGIQIVGYESICDNIAFVSDMLPVIIRNIVIVNEEIGHVYEYILFKEKYPHYIENKIISYGFIKDTTLKCYRLPLPVSK